MFLDNALISVTGFADHPSTRCAPKVADPTADPQSETIAQAPNSDPSSITRPNPYRRHLLTSRSQPSDAPNDMTTTAARGRCPARRELQTMVANCSLANASVRSREQLRHYSNAPEVTLTEKAPTAPTRTAERKGRANPNETAPTAPTRTATNRPANPTTT